MPLSKAKQKEWMREYRRRVRYNAQPTVIPNVIPNVPVIPSTPTNILSVEATRAYLEKREQAKMQSVGS